MKKYFVFSFLLIVVIFVCTGCDGDVTRSLRHDGFSVGEDIVCDAFIGKNATEQVRWFTGDHFITADGDIYELSLSQQYSNKTNCRPADTTLKVAAILDNKIVKGTDGKYYTLINQNNGGGAYEVVSESDNSYSIYDILLKSGIVEKVVTVDSNSGTYYVLKTDGNIYNMVVRKANSNSAPEVKASNVVYSKEDYGGEIIDFNYSGESGATFVRTQEKSYRLVATNEDQCTKFADIKCEYQMMESASFSKYGSYILAYNGSMIITTYGKTFSVNA